MSVDNADAFAQSCIDVMSDKSLWENLSKSSRALIREKYTWNAFFHALQHDLDGLLLGKGLASEKQLSGLKSLADPNRTV